MGDSLRPPGRPPRRVPVALLVQDLDAVGGMERSTRLLAHELARRGRRVTVLTSIPSPPGALALRVEEGQPTVVRIPWPTGWHYTAAELAFYGRAALWLLAHPGRWRVLHGVYLPTCGALAALLGTLLRRPSVVRLACSGPPGDVAIVARHPARRLLEWLLGRASAVACPGGEIAREVEAVAPGARCHRIPNGVDVEAFRPPREGELARDPDLVLAVVRLRAEKAVPRLLDAWKRVEGEHPRAVLEVVGDGPERERVLAHAKTLRLRGARFPGSRDDVPGRLRRAAVFVQASDAEGMSNALLEAMASGCACVATDLEANREALGETGVLVAREPAAIARGILDLLGDPARREALGRAARARAVSELSIGTMVDRYEALYGQVARPGPFLSNAPPREP